MAKSQESIGQFSCRVSSELLEKFEGSKPKGFTSQTLGNAMVRLWCSLPPEVHTELLISETLRESNPKAAGDSLLSIVKRCVEKVLDERDKRKGRIGG